MTSPEIQQAAFLDLLFENRNKLYGAYNLRKFYNQRLATALLLSIALALILLLVIAKNIRQGTAAVPKYNPGELTVHTFVIPEQPKPIIPPPPTQPKPATASLAQRQYVQIHITTDPVTTNDVPAQGDLKDAVISNTTIAGVPAPATPVVSNSNAGTEPQTQTPVYEGPLSAEPQFPGGAAAWAAFLSRHLQAPETLETGEKKTVFVTFLVDADGSVTHFDVVQSGGAAFDAEVIRVLKKMPKWKPALRNGQPAAVSFTQPVTFIAMGE